MEYYFPPPKITTVTHSVPRRRQSHGNYTFGGINGISGILGLATITQFVPRRRRSHDSYTLWLALIGLVELVGFWDWRQLHTLYLGGAKVTTVTNFGRHYWD